MFFSRDYCCSSSTDHFKCETKIYIEQILFYRELWEQVWKTLIQCQLLYQNILVPPVPMSRLLLFTITFLSMSQLAGGWDCGGARIDSDSLCVCGDTNITRLVNISNIQRRSNSRETLGSILKTNFYK